MSLNGDGVGVVVTESSKPLPTGVHLPIYMDNHATTPLDPRVRAEMLQYMDDDFGNAGSRTHEWGRRARTAQ